MYIWKYCKSGNFCYDLNFFFFRNLFWKVILGKHCKIFKTQKLYPVLFAIWNFSNCEQWLMQIKKSYTFFPIICQFYETRKNPHILFVMEWLYLHFELQGTCYATNAVWMDLMLCCCFLLYSLIICNLTLSHTFNWDTLIRESSEKLIN